MALNSRFTGSVSKLQLHLKQQRLLLFVAALSLLLPLFNFKDWKIFSPVPFSPGQYHNDVTTSKTEWKTITPKQYSRFFKSMCRSPLRLLQLLQESSYSVTHHYCAAPQGEGAYFLCMITGILQSQVNSSLSDYTASICMLLLLQLYIIFILLTQLLCSMAGLCSLLLHIMPELALI